MACIVAGFKLIERTSIRRSLAKLKQAQCPANVRLERLYNKAHSSSVDRKGLILIYPVRCVSF